MDCLLNVVTFAHFCQFASKWALNAICLNALKVLCLSLDTQCLYPCKIHVYIQMFKESRCQKFAGTCKAFPTGLQPFTFTQ